MVQQIQTYGSIRPQPIGGGANDERIKALSNLGKAVGDIAFSIGAKKRSKEGELEGAKAGALAAEQGEAPVQEEGLFPSIYGEAYNNAQKKSYLASTDRLAIERLSSIESESSHSLEEYEARSKAMLEGIMKETPEEYKPLLDQSIKGYISRGRIRVNENILKRGREEAASELLGSVDTYSREASRAARNGDSDAVQEMLAKVELAGVGLVENRTWTREEADEALRRARNETTEQAYLQIVDDMPLSEAAAAIDEAEQNVPKGFSGDEWDSLIARARVRLESRIAETKAGQAMSKDEFRERQAAVEIAIKTGEGDPDEIMLELTSLFNSGVYTPSQYAGHISTVYNDQKKIQKVLDRWESNDASILVEPDAVNKVYNKSASEMTPSQKIRYAKSVNMVPDRLKSELTNSLYAGDIQQAADAANIIKQLEEVQGLPEALSSRDMAYASQITKLMNVYSPEQAIDMARKNTDPRDKDRIETRKLEIKEDYDTDDWKSGAEKAIGPWFGSIDPMVMPNVAADYKAAFESAYIAGMDEDDAHESAEKALKRVYSEFNGRPVKNSPEKYYQVGGSAEWVKDDIKKTLKETIAGSPEIEDYYLISDSITDALAGKGIPGYFIRYKTPEGGWDVIGRYYPDIEGQRAKVGKEAEEKVKDIREGSTKPTRRTRSRR